MLISHWDILDIQDKSKFQEELADKLVDLVENVIKTDIERPSIVMQERETAVIFYCDAELYTYLKDLISTGLGEDINIVQLMKVYKKIKGMQDKSKEKKGS